MAQPNSLPVSCWHYDDLGHSIADGTIDEDDVSLAAVGQILEYEKELERLEDKKKFEEWWDKYATPLNTDVADDF